MRTLEETYELLKTNPYFDFFLIKKNYERRLLSKEELLKIYENEKEQMQPYMHRYENPFLHILHFDVKYFNSFEKGDYIIIQEKIDGSNTHFNTNGIEFNCYGNNFILNEVNNLQGYYQFVKNNFSKVTPKYYDLDIYGEWLVPHHCEYPADMYGRFYVFDIMENGEYWSQDKVKKFTKECGFDYAPILFKGPFTSWKDAMKYVGTTKMNGEKGEGIIIKNQSKLNRKDLPFYTKIVDVEFQETNKAREKVITIDMNKILEIEEKIEIVASIVTLARVRKIILKFVDSNLLNPNWKQMDTKYTYNIVRSAIFKDCIKEENDIVTKVGKIFPKYCNKNIMSHIETLKNE